MRWGRLENIEHFVVLMLENSSFDNLLGTLYPKSATFEGLDINATNPDPTGAPKSHCLVRANVAVSPVREKSSLINFHQSFRSDPENIPSNHTIETAQV
jgi:phospholipase C